MAGGNPRFWQNRVESPVRVWRSTAHPNRDSLYSIPSVRPRISPLKIGYMSDYYWGLS
ncbi:hypothetical protein BD310DRAFT_941911 [Dichomitus squalens]|uniref:Uncharacterized protein n=1 Tax=Dichomitus squalens TaxID=114155 RepID=A0A4Q9PAC3_9APHY|nr:hypothetical protein BD310DRAFT_941911 [Dichomitus squalens]